MGSHFDALGVKLSDLVGVKVTFPLHNDKELVMKVYARLCLLYDETWYIDPASPSCKCIQRFLNILGIGHLCPKPPDITDPRRLPRVWSAFLAIIETRYGSGGLYPRLRKVLLQQQKLEARRETDKARGHCRAPASRADQRAEPAQTRDASCSSQESDSVFRFARPGTAATTARSRHMSSSSTASASSVASQGDARPRSRIPVSSRHNAIPTGRHQLMRTPCDKSDAAAALPLPAVASPPVPVMRISGRALAAAKLEKTAGEFLPSAMVRKSQAHRLSPLMMGKQRRSFIGNISYELVAPAPVRRSEDDSSLPVKSMDSPADTAAAEVAPSPLAKPPSTERRRSLVPVAVPQEQILGQYIEERLNSDFPATGQRANSAEGPSLPTEPASGEPTTLNTTFTPDKPAPVEVGTERAHCDVKTSSVAGSAGNEQKAVLLELTADIEETLPQALARNGELGAKALDENRESGSSENAVNGKGGNRRSTFDIVPAPEGGQTPSVDGTSSSHSVAEIAPEPVPKQSSNARLNHDLSVSTPLAEGATDVTVEKKPAKRQARARKGRSAPGVTESDSGDVPVTVPAVKSAVNQAAKPDTRAMKPSPEDSAVEKAEVADITAPKRKQGRGRKKQPAADSVKTEEDHKRTVSNRTDENNRAREPAAGAAGPSSHVETPEAKIQASKRRQTRSKKTQGEDEGKELDAAESGKVISRSTRSQGGGEPEPATEDAAPSERRTKRSGRRGRGRAAQEQREPVPTEATGPPSAAETDQKPEQADTAFAGPASLARPRRAAAKKAVEALHVHPPESSLPAERKSRRLRLVRDSYVTPPEPSPPPRDAKPAARGTRSRRPLRPVENCE